ncbi:MAG: hypothetical protein ACP5OB_04780 [Candidatus Ratteibacteria bacterium]
MKNYFVILNDYGRFKTFVEDLKKKHKINEFDIKIFDAKKIKLDEILKKFDFLPVFSEKVLLIIKNVEEFTKKDCEKLYEVLNKLPEGILIILYGSSIEEPFEESSIKENYKTPENMLFSKIYSLKEQDNKRIFEILKEYIKIRERNFTLLISGIEVYLRNIIKNEKKLRKEIIKKIDALYNFDYSLKVGRIELGSELEINLLYYLFSTFD